MKQELIIGAIVNSLCGISQGYNSAIVSGLRVQIIKYTYFDNLTDESLLSFYYGLYSAALLFGMVIGSTVGMWFADKLGRKKSLISCALLLLIAPIACAFITNYWGVFVVRIVLGVAVGICSCVGPLFVTETVEAKWRGVIGGMFQLLLTLSMAFGYLVNMVFAKNDYNENLPFETWQWAWQYAIGAVIGGMLLITCFWVKETDIWLNKQKKRGESPGVNAKINVNEKNKLTAVAKAKWYGIGVVLGLICQLSGINSVMFYSNSILSKAGITNPYVSTLCVVGLWNFVSTAIAQPFIKKFQRRTLYFWSYVGLTLGNLIMALSYFTDVTALAVIGIVVFLFMFEIGPGCLFWIVASEAFPGQIRETGMSFSVTASNLANLLVTFCFPILEEAIGARYCFLIFTIVCFIGALFIYFCLPETSGEIDERADKKSGEIEATPIPDEEFEKSIHKDAPVQGELPVDKGKPTGTVVTMPPPPTKVVESLGLSDDQKPKEESKEPQLPNVA